MSRGMYCLLYSEFGWSVNGWFISPVERADEAKGILKGEDRDGIPDWLVEVRSLDDLRFPAFVIA